MPPRLRPCLHRPAALRVLGPEELHAERVHPVGEGAITGREGKGVVVCGPVDHVQVAGGKDPVCGGVGAVR